MSPRPPIWRRLLGTLLAAAAFAFLILAIARNVQDVRRLDWQVEPVVLALSLLALVAVFAWGVYVWARVLDHFGRPAVPFPALLRIWFLSSLARYIPGKVWQFVAAAQLARGIGLSGALLLTSMLVHVGFSLLAALVVGALTLPLEALGTGAPPAWLRAGIVLIALILVHPVVLNGALRLVPRAVHRDVLVWNGRWRHGIALLALAASAWLFYGAAFYLFIRALVYVPAGTVPALAGVNALSFAAGYVVFLVPAGLGIREASMALLLTPFAPQGVAAVIAIASRLWTIAGEVAGGAGAFVLSRKARQTARPG